MFSSSGDVFLADAEASDGPMLSRIDSSVVGRRVVRNSASKPLHTHPCMSVLLAVLASAAAVTILISLCSVSQRRLAAQGLDTRLLSDGKKPNTGFTVQCGGSSKSSNRSPSSSQKRLPLKKRKLPVLEDTAPGIEENVWISGAQDPPPPSSSKSLLLELLLRPSVALSPGQDMGFAASHQAGSPAWVGVEGSGSVDPLHHTTYTSSSEPSSSTSMTRTAQGVPGSASMPPSPSASDVREPLESPLREASRFWGVPGANYDQHPQHAPYRLTGSNNLPSATWILLEGSRGRLTPQSFSPAYQVTRELHRETRAYQTGHWMQELATQVGGTESLSHDPPPETPGPGILFPISHPFPSNRLGASGQRAYPFIPTPRYPGADRESFAQLRPTESHMQHRAQQFRGPPDVHSVTDLIAAGGCHELECQELGNEWVNTSEGRNSSSENDSDEAKHPGAVPFEQPLGRDISVGSAQLPSLHPSATPLLGDGGLEHHLFFRQPRLHPQVVLRPFCASVAFSLKRVPSDAVPLLDEARKTLTQQSITPHNLERLTEVAELLVSHAVVHHTSPLTHCTYLRAVGGLGLRFLILDAVFCITTLTGELLPNTWFERLASLLPDDIPPPPQAEPLDERSRFLFELLKGLSRALRILKTGKRPLARDVVTLKQMLLCSRLSHRRFLAAPFDGWRADNRAYPTGGGNVGMA